MRWWWKYTVYCAVTIRDRMSGRPAFRRIYPQPKRAVSFKRFARSPARVYATYASARNTSRSGSIIFNSRAELTRIMDEYKRDVIGEGKLESMRDLAICGGFSAAPTKESVFRSRTDFFISYSAFIYLKQLRLIVPQMLPRNCFRKLNSRKTVIVRFANQSFSPCLRKNLCT